MTTFTDREFGTSYLCTRCDSCGQILRGICPIRWAIDFGLGPRGGQKVTHTCPACIDGLCHARPWPSSNPDGWCILRRGHDDDHLANDGLTWPRRYENRARERQEADAAQRTR